jgi:hypothetical protein
VTAFEHVITLLSFIYALALTHLLSRVGALTLARERVRFSGLQALVTVNAVGQVFLTWLAIRDSRGRADVDLITVVVGFAYAISVYLFCAAAAPEAADGPIDLDAFYWRNRRVFYGFYALSVVAALAASFSVLGTPNQGTFLGRELLTLMFFAPCALAIAVPARWAQWVSGVGLLAVTVGWLVRFDSVLN